MEQDAMPGKTLNQASKAASPNHLEIVEAGPCKRPAPKAAGP